MLGGQLYWVSPSVRLPCFLAKFDIWGDNSVWVQGMRSHLKKIEKKKLETHQSDKHSSLLSLAECKAEENLFITFEM